MNAFISGRRGFLRAGLTAGMALALRKGVGAAGLPSRPPASAGTSAAGRVCLPQNDPHPRARQVRLDVDQRIYQYAYDYISPLAMVRTVPLRDTFSPQFLVQAGGQAANVVENLLAVRSGRPDAMARRSRGVSAVTGIAASGTAPVGNVVRAALDIRAAIGRPQSLEDYAALFRTIALPGIAADFQDDAVFALMRVAGPNPLMLTRVGSLDARFPVTENMYQQTLPGDSLAAAAAEGRLYLADFQILGQVQAGTIPAPKFVYAPLALFAVDKATGELVPVAIQCAQQPGPANPIFTPLDGWGWMIAKTVVEIGDGNVHEMVSHLGRTHLLLEPFAIATHRHLAANHPLGVLLRPHFEGTLAINHGAVEHLVNANGPVDLLLAGTIDSSLALAAAGVLSWPFNQMRPPDTFRARGVDDTGALPDYPYRDDALLYWNAIRRWIAAYLSLYYPTELDLAQDYELAAWAQELVAQDGGRVVGFGEAGGISTLDYLIDAAAVIVFTASVQHAAVNFPQFDLMSYTPNMPLAGYAPAPASTTGRTEQDFLDLLPPLEMASLQLAVLYELGTVHYTTLGEYGPGYFSDPRVQPTLAAFQQELDQIGAIIDERNLSRRPYEFLARAGIPQSINI